MNVPILLFFLYLVFNSYRDQLEISNAEEQGVSYHPYPVEAQHIEHGYHDLKGAEVHDELLHCWRISAPSGIISYEFSNCCFKSLHFSNPLLCFLLTMNILQS